MEALRGMDTTIAFIEVNHRVVEGQTMAINTNTSTRLDAAVDGQHVPYKKVRTVYIVLLAQQYVVAATQNLCRVSIRLQQPAIHFSDGRPLDASTQRITNVVADDPSCIPPQAREQSPTATCVPP
jgi:hypothetical protein